MRRIVRLTESDLVRLVKRVIREQPARVAYQDVNSGDYDAEPKNKYLDDIKNIDSKDDYLNYCESESIEPGEMFECYGRYISDSMFKDYFNPYDDLDPLNNKKILEGYLGGYIPTEFRLAEADGSDWY